MAKDADGRREMHLTTNCRVALDEKRMVIDENRFELDKEERLHSLRERRWGRSWNFWLIS